MNRPYRLALALAALLASCAAAPVRADEPTAPAAAPSFEWHSWTWAGVLRTDAGDLTPIVGARFAVKVNLPAGLILGARVDASRQQDGGTDKVEVSDPNTFQTGEGYVELRRPVAKGLSVGAIYGVAVPFEGGRAGVLERYPQTKAVGVRFDSPGVVVRAYVGAYDAAGPGVKGILSAEVSTGGPTSTVVETAQPGGAVRVLGVFRLK